MTTKGRFRYAISISILAGIEAAIIGLPAGYLLEKLQYSQAGEFEGPAILGSMAVTSAIMSITVLVISFALVTGLYRGESRQYPAITRALAISIAIAVIGIVIAVLLKAAWVPPWVIGLSAISLIVGLVHAFRLEL